MVLIDDMDIPESGAVFTLGKSYLSENHQSYFFIKNDAIRKLICGQNQSAVVCESGRVFVWGENQFGQLGIGSAEIVTKPSCVKAIKTLGYRVRNVAYGKEFGVILTENSKIYYSGKSIFDDGVRFREKFWNLGNEVLITRKPFEIEEFADCLRRNDDIEGNVLHDQYVDVSAGENHFVVLTGSGKLYGWGCNKHHQLGGGGSGGSSSIKPSLISRNEMVRVVSCGRYCTAFISAKNEIFIAGTLNDLLFVSLTKINTTSFEDLMYSLYASVDDDIYLVINSGEIFKSAERDGTLTFVPHNVINENIRKICTGNGFVSIVTESNKLLTTFREKSSAQDNGRLRSPRELRKFAKLDVLDAVSGENHLLVHGIHPAAPILSSSSNEFDDDHLLMNQINNNNDNDNNQRAFNQTYTKPVDQTTLADKLKQCLAGVVNKETASKIPIADVRRKSNCDERSTAPTSRKSSQNSLDNGQGTAAVGLNEVTQPADIIIENESSQRRNITEAMEKSSSLNEFELLEQAAAEISEIESTGIEMIRAAINDNEEEEEQEEVVVEKPATGSIVTSPESVPSTSAQTEFYFSPEPNDVVETTSVAATESIQMDTVEDEQSLESVSQNMSDDHPVAMPANDITFIDNGYEVKTTSQIDIVKEMNDAIEKQDDEIVELTAEQMVDQLLGEDLNVIHDAEAVPLDMIEETKLALKEVVEDVIEPMDARRKLQTPTKKLSMPPQDEDERTTASIGSISSDKNVFDMDTSGRSSRNQQDSSTADGILLAAAAKTGDQQPQENGRVKRFINDMRNKGKSISCKSSNVVVGDDATTNNAEKLLPIKENKNRSLNDDDDDDDDGNNRPSDKTSKVCTIL